MSIDWITVVAQIANFLVLVWLLRRFLYRPILDGIDAREAEIAERMQQAVRAKKQAQAQEDAYHDKVQALNVAQAQMTETIRKTAEEQRDFLLAEAQQALDQAHARWQAHMDEETRKYTAKLHHAGASALLALTRKALGDLADATLESQMAQHVVNQIKPMATNLRRAAGEAAEAVATSHTPLPASAQEELATALHDLFPEVSLRCETDKDQAPGLVLRIGGAQLAWTLDTYIDGLEALLAEKLSAGADHKEQSDDG
ncbi:F0F1 ATP synthase subunit B family protein [Yoonia sediminilitoris]|uniref:ATP synthase subunit b n=1 Tax=Yoonia sediminilitoris TaxID=1286148 RepID=A0A2T6KJV2_9RHOB|nr:F0F1 ATP synthase subunit delta [Yoonia sediminilitoris]PUB16189.1 ATP synthase F0 subcomplex B subunit [Yoonia sediminilitoris]RCW96538.1 ATP synthase F0 subcomplex B subunit [Yoonia sediminilitoris]